jgi:hypothetical protein
MKFERYRFRGLPKPSSAVVLFLIVCAGCISLPQNYTRTEPDREQLVGTWVPDQATLRDLKLRGGYDTTTTIEVTLQKDGSFQITNMPDWWGDALGRSYKSFNSYSGKWEIWRSPGASNWQILFKGSRKVWAVDLFNNTPPYRLYFIAGDPDADQGMTFVRK